MSATRLVLYQGSAFTIEWFYDERGRSLAREFFLALPDSRKAAFLALARRLGDAGVIRDETKFRNEGDKIFAFKPQPERYLCFFFAGRKVIITNGFEKKSQKLSPQEKEKAVRAKKNYEHRVKNGSYYETFTKIQKRL
ncbi:MAG: type II toxin-antitoxin system RelE/ParE family toxin [Deltaproteobacteria bacterium]|nr:type II toxin-antitoxin system RelE/ParE family toxin [Deltaproteobacteria bacterium]